MTKSTPKETETIRALLTTKFIKEAASTWAPESAEPITMRRKCSPSCRMLQREFKGEKTSKKERDFAMKAFVLIILRHFTANTEKLSICEAATRIERKLSFCFLPV